jgi:uncharacterized protein YbjT (DUF2867 family)
MRDSLIAITGATGNVGSRVAKLLAARGERQRLIVRDADRAPQLEGAEVSVVSGYAATDELRRAVQGAETVFLIPAHESATRVAEHASAVDAIVAAGVHRLVYLSWVNASPDLVFTFGRHHFATEQHIRASGIPFTFLRMPFYVDVIPSLVGADGIISGPAGDGRVAAVLRDDIAESAVATLLGEGHVGKTYNLTGSEAFTFTEAAKVMSRVSGKSSRFHNETMDEAYASRAKYGAPDWEVDGWVTTYAGVAANELSRVSDDVRILTGREPGSLTRYVETNPDSLAHVVSSPAPE